MSIKIDAKAGDYLHLYVVVNFGQGSKVMKIAKKAGAGDCTVSIGRGTARDTLAKLFCLDETRREVVNVLVTRDQSKKIIEQLNEKMRFDKPSHGIIFTIPVCYVEKSANFHEVKTKLGENTEDVMHKLITVIVDRGKGEDVMDTAYKAGTKGGTILNARGAGLYDTSKVFGMEIEPEKEMVLILADTDLAEKIVEYIYEELEMEKPGHGIIYVQNVSSAFGLAQ